MNRFQVLMLVFLVGSFPVVSAYFGIGNFEVPGTGDTTDTDEDNIPDWWENLSWWNSTCGLNYLDPTDNVSDFDGDDSINYWEYIDRTNPCLSNDDSDLDGMPDKWEDANGLGKYDPDDGLVDLDSDALINYYEYLNGTNVTNPDTDNDNLLDGWEVYYLLNPLNASDATIDSDGDNLTNLQEYNKGTDPLKQDTDGNGVNDDIDPFSCPIMQKWCNVLDKCIFLLDKCEAPPPPGGGGGGGPAPTPPPTLPPVFKPGVSTLTAQLLIELILKQKLEGKSFWTVPNSVAAALVLTGEYPSPISPLVRGLLSKPIKMLLEPLKVFRGQKVESPEAIKDVYRFFTERVLAKYSQSDVVVIAVREPAVDSMAAVAYAKSLDAPILLTEQNDAPEETINAVKQLNPKKIIIIGGTVAVSEGVESEFKKIAPTERIWGQTRYETAVELAEKLDPSIVVITDGEEPFLDAVIVASEYKAPIIYVRGKEIPDPTREFLVKHIQTKQGNPMSWVTVGIDEDVHTEIQGLYSLPEFLTKNRLTLKLYQLGTRFLR